MKITRKNFASLYPKGLKVSEIRKGFEETIELCDTVVLPMAAANWKYSPDLFDDDALTESKINEIIEDQLEVLNLLIDSDNSLLIVKASSSIDLRKERREPRTESSPKPPKRIHPFPVNSYVALGKRAGIVLSSDGRGSYIDVVFLGGQLNKPETIINPAKNKDLIRLTKDAYELFQANYNPDDYNIEKPLPKKDSPKPRPKKEKKPTEPKTPKPSVPTPQTPTKPDKGKQAKPQADDKPQPRSVNRVSIAQSIAKKFLAMNNKQPQKAKIINLLQEIAKAANRRVFKLDTLNGEMMDYVQMQLLAILKQIESSPEKTNKNLVLSEDSLNAIQPIAFVQESNIIKLCNRYVQLADAKTPELSGGKLLKDIDNAVDKKVLKEKHRLFPILMQIKARLEQKKYAPTNAMLGSLKGFI